MESVKNNFNFINNSHNKKQNKKYLKRNPSKISHIQCVRVYDFYSVSGLTMPASITANIFANHVFGGIKKNCKKKF